MAGEREKKGYYESEEKEINLRKTFFKIKEAIYYYIDIEPEKVNLISLWVIGTWIRGLFNPFPYLFINAGKGSGKSRLLGLLEAITKNSRKASSISPASIRRISGEKITLLLDEFEGKDKEKSNAYNEILNQAYKKGDKIFFVSDRKDRAITEIKPEISVATGSIEQINNVTRDRGIKIIMNKSDKDDINNLIEDYEENENLKEIKKELRKIQHKLGLILFKEKRGHPKGVLLNDIYRSWNHYVKGKDYDEKYKELYKRLIKTGIKGRDFERAYALLNLAFYLNDDTNFPDTEPLGFDLFQEVTETLKENFKEQKEDDTETNPEMILLSHLMEGDYNESEYYQAETIYLNILDTRGIHRHNFSDKEERDKLGLNTTIIGLIFRNLNLLKDIKRPKNRKKYQLDFTQIKKEYDKRK